MPLGHPLDPLSPLVEVPNFTGTSKLTLSCDSYGNQPLVHLTQSAGSMRFTHSLTLEEADKMASSLRLLINALVIRPSVPKQ